MNKNLIVSLALFIALIAGVYLISVNTEMRKSASNTTPMLYFSDSSGSILEQKQVKVGDVFDMVLMADSLDKQISQVVLRSTYETNKIEIVSPFVLGSAFGSKYAESTSGGSLKSGFVVTADTRPTGQVAVASFKVKILGLPAKIEISPSGDNGSGSSISALGNFVENLQVKSINFVAEGGSNGNPEISFSVKPSNVVVVGGNTSFDLVAKLTSAVKLGSFRIVLSSNKGTFAGTTKDGFHPAIRGGTNIYTGPAGELIVDYNQPQGTNKNELPAGEFVLGNIKMAGLPTTGSVTLRINPESDFSVWTGNDFSVSKVASLFSTSLTLNLSGDTSTTCSGTERKCEGETMYKACQNGTWGPALSCGSGNSCAENGVCYSRNCNPANCPAPANSTARCVENSCVYDCNSGFTRTGDVCSVSDSNAYRIKFRVSFGGVYEGTDSGTAGDVSPVYVELLSPDIVGDWHEIRVALRKVGSVCRVVASNGSCELALKTYEGEIGLNSATTKYSNAALLIRGERHLVMKYGADGQDAYYNRAKGQLVLQDGKTFDFSKYPILPGDVNNDQIVDGRDYGIVVSLLGSKQGGRSDLDYSGQVNAQDLNLLKLTLNEKQSQLY